MFPAIANSHLRGAAVSSVVSGGGSGTDLLSLDAGNQGQPGYKYWTLTGNYLGGFLMPEAGNGGSTYGFIYTGDMHRIGIGTTSSKLFSTGFAQNGNPFFAEVTIPTLTTSTDITTWIDATSAQNFRSIITDFTNEFGDSAIRGICYDQVSGQLFVNQFRYYSADPDTNNWAHYSDATDLSGSTKTGYYALGGATRSVGTMVRLPSAYATSMGKTHLAIGGLGNIAVADRVSFGVSIWKIDGASASSGGAVEITNFPLADPMVEGGSTLYNSQMWNYVTSIGNAWIVPGTRTLMMIGTNWDNRLTPNNTQVYYYNQANPGTTGQNDIGEAQSGYYVWRHEAYCGYYWCFDLDEIEAIDAGSASATSLRPYEHGYLDNLPRVLNHTRRNWASCFDDRSNRIYIGVEAGASGHPDHTNSPAILVYDFQPA